MAKITYPTIPEDVLIDLKVSGSFYQALSQLILALTQELSNEEYAACLDKIKTKEPASNAKELNILLMVSLLFSLEQGAKDQGLNKDVEIEIPDESEKSTS